jgi:phage shock protein PspC (stress-responsive transcriptional regulator)
MDNERIVPESAGGEEQVPPSDSGSSEEQVPPGDSGSGEEQVPPSDSGSGEEQVPPGTSGSSEEQLPPKVTVPRINASRRRQGRMIAGVAAGLAEYFNVDPLIIRAIFIVLVFVGGAGIPLYIACWLLIPDEGKSQPVVEKLIEDMRQSEGWAEMEQKAERARRKAIEKIRRPRK